MAAASRFVVTKAVEVQIHTAAPAVAGLIITVTSGTVYLGPTGVTRANGFPVLHATTLILPALADDLFAIAASDTVAVNTLAVV